MSRKRSRSPEGDASSSDDDFGPALPSTIPPKKKRKLPYESLYIAALPQCAKYSKSLMHRDQLAFVHVAPDPLGFVISASVDGVVKFWKKGLSLEFAKEFKAAERIDSADYARGMYAALSPEGISIFDVQNLDLVQTISVAGTCVCWVSGRVGVAVGPTVRLYDLQGGFESVSVHRADVMAMAYNPKFDCVVSADAAGMVEYWAPSGEKPASVFAQKSGTGLFEFRKAKSVPCAISMSPTGTQWASMSLPDRKVRLFDFATGKLVRSYDESVATLSDLHAAGKEIHALDEREFERRMGVERELELVKSRLNVCFDESGHFISYGSLHGIKTVNTVTNRVVKLYGAEESFRAVHVGLYQGTGQKGVMTVSMAASSNPILEAAEEKDPMLVCTGFGKVRFYMFTNEDATKERDVHNERMQKGKKKDTVEAKAQLGRSATIHTNLGDIHVKLFADQTPKTIENFTTHARNGYYNNTIFHRVIRKFMVQGGDPLGDGTGGTSIWGKEFEDEIVPELKHDRPYTLSMANAGPGTNGSQFFITTVEAGWLDGKHTVFGRVEKGKDVVHLIENVRVNKEKPEEDVKIINISVQ